MSLDFTSLQFIFFHFIQALDHSISFTSLHFFSFWSMNRIKSNKTESNRAHIIFFSLPKHAGGSLLIEPSARSSCTQKIRNGRNVVAMNLSDRCIHSLQTLGGAIGRFRAYVVCRAIHAPEKVFGVLMDRARTNGGFRWASALLCHFFLGGKFIVTPFQ